MHYPTSQTTCQHPFVDRIMEADIPLGWKPSNLEQYDETTDPDERLDTLLTHGVAPSLQCGFGVAEEYLCLS